MELRTPGRRVVETVFGGLWLVLVGCSTASAQQVDADNRAGDRDRGDASATSDPAPVALQLEPPALASVGPGARAALNLEVVGWTVAFSSVPAVLFAITPFNCRLGRGGRGSSLTPGVVAGLTIGVGTVLAIVGTILRARRMRGIPRTRMMQRQALYRAPWARGVGLTALSLGTAIGTSYATALPIADQCLD